jgi:hypothetical protein
VASLLDRGWDAYWILAQPLYVLVRFVDALGELARQKTTADASGTGSQTYTVDKAARLARQAAREKALEDKK